MTNQLIAVATRQDGTVSPHAGRAMRWQVFAVVANSAPELAWTIRLTDMGSLHEWHVRDDNSRHPLHAVDVAIAGSAGEGVSRRLQEKGTRLITTAESDSLQAVLTFLKGDLKKANEHDESDCLNPEHRRKMRDLSEMTH